MLPNSGFHVDDRTLAVFDPQADFLRANAGCLGRRQKERQRE